MIPLPFYPRFFVAFSCILDHLLFVLFIRSSLLIIRSAELPFFFRARRQFYLSVQFV